MSVTPVYLGHNATTPVDPGGVEAMIAFGFPPAQALDAVRLSLGRRTTRQDVDLAATHLDAAWRLASQQPAFIRAVADQSAPTEDLIVGGRL